MMSIYAQSLTNIFINPFLLPHDMEYRATYGIEGGVSPGFGVKYQDFCNKTRQIVADGPEAAYARAMSVAEELAVDHLTNPENELTIVHLESLVGPQGSVPVDHQQSIVVRTTLDHILALSRRE
jgi:hypothetical protein